MDLKVYYQKLRKIEAGIADGDVVVVSLETPDGGRAGVRVETPRSIAAQLIVDGRARLATPEESKEFRDRTAKAKHAFDQQAAASRMQITVVSEADLRALRGPVRGGAGTEAERR